MYFFIAIIFIAELIITATLLFFINKADKKVCEFSQKTIETRDLIINGIRDFRCVIIDAKEKIQQGIDYIIRKKEQYTINVIKNVLMYVLLFSLKGRCKKAASICSMIAMAKDFYDKNYANV